MKQGIYIIGNGFDIQSEIYSSYGTFLKQSTHLSNNGFYRWLKYAEGMGKWVDFEREILNLSKILKSFFEQYPLFTTVTKNIDEKYFPLFACLFNFEFSGSKEKGKIVPIESNKIIKEWSTFFEGEILRRSKVVEWVLNEVKIVLDSFTQMLIEASNNAICSNQIMKLFDEYDKKYFFNYNYTNTLEKYEIDTTQIFNIHGTLNEPIWGHNKIEYEPFISFNKINKRRYKFQSDNYADIAKASGIEGLEHDGNSYNNLETDIIILGHSVDVNDMDLYKKLFHISGYGNVENLKLIIYDHNGDSENKIYNLYKHIEGDILTKMNNNKKIEKREFTKPNSLIK